ncbi:hypothetical protein EXW50_01610 [Bacillus mycoides]|nr:hypothetical protein EXW26_01610 [Bacillus mycoides]QWG72994.1 hypothetical protein EXW63_12765 [Bacillus mycoides]QWH21196.1 hypothetical protein EXW50_01610 [Bacillus mycoides]
MHKQVAYCLFVMGVASGKCGFTTIRKFQIKKPNFSTNQNREIELFSYFIYLLNSLIGRSIQVYESYLGYTMNVMHLV